MQQEISLGKIQCPGRVDSEQATNSRKFIPAAERKARIRIGNNPDGLQKADILAELTRQEWISLRKKEKEEMRIIDERIISLRKQTSLHRKTIKEAAAAQIRFIYKKKINFIFSKGWFDTLEWRRFGKRIGAARRLFSFRERSLLGIMLNAAHLSLKDTGSNRSFTSYLFSKEARIEGLERWIDSERKNLKNRQNLKKTVQIQNIRDAEHRAYAAVSRSLKEEIQLEKQNFEIVSDDFKQKRALLKESCQKRWDSLAPALESQTNFNPTIQIRKDTRHDFNF